MQSIQAFDVGMWNWLQSLQGPIANIIMIWISALGHITVLLGIFIAALVWARVRHRTDVAAFLGAAFLGGMLLEFLIPPLVARSRPQAVMPDGTSFLQTPLLPWGYPSQYTLLAAVTFLPLGMVAADVLPHRRRLFRILAGSAVFLIGVSRMYLGVCYPTDVVGGWLGGTAWVLACGWVWERHGRASPVAQEPTPAGGVALPVDEQGAGPAVASD
jgi:undecaprenyl-diphosphatase